MPKYLAVVDDARKACIEDMWDLEQVIWTCVIAIPALLTGNLLSHQFDVLLGDTIKDRAAKSNLNRI